MDDRDASRSESEAGSEPSADSTHGIEPDARTGADADSDSEEADDLESHTDAAGRREVVVPLRLYKTVTVFSTLIAIVGILGGFILLDVATNRAQADLSEINVALAVLGIAAIAAGAVTYAFSTRFRTDGMGNAKDDTDEHSTNNNGR